MEIPPFSDYNNKKNNNHSRPYVNITRSRRGVPEENESRMRRWQRRSRAEVVVVVMNESNPSTTTTTLDEDTLCEILSRIPVKSLMRFKCVSKRWQALIQRDRYLIDLHLTRSKTRPGATTLLISTVASTQDDVDKDGVGMCLFSADLLKGGPGVPRKLACSTSSLACTQHVDEYILKPVNGLICFVLHQKGYIRFANISTREQTPWIRITIKDEEVYKDCEFNHRCSFGFDPKSKQHKVINLWGIYKFKRIPSIHPDDVKVIREQIAEVCEVMTVGNYTWRRIDIEFPKYEIQYGPGVYMNGSIYWMSSGYALSELWKRNNPQCYKQEPPYDSGQAILVFDVRSEKFIRVIHIPSFIIYYQPPQGSCDDEFYFRCLGLFEVDGRMALIDAINSYMIKLWIFDDDHQHDIKSINNSTSTASSTHRRNNWIDETISMDFELEWYYSLEAIPQTDQIIINKPLNNQIDILSPYYYDRKRKTFKKVEISGMAKNRSSRHYKINTFTESLLRV